MPRSLRTWNSSTVGKKRDGRLDVGDLPPCEAPAKVRRGFEGGDSRVHGRRLPIKAIRYSTCMPWRRASVNPEAKENYRARNLDMNQMVKTSPNFLAQLFQSKEMPLGAREPAAAPPQAAPRAFRSGGAEPGQTPPEAARPSGREAQRTPRPDVARPANAG